MSIIRLAEKQQRNIAKFTTTTGSVENKFIKIMHEENQLLIVQVVVGEPKPSL